MAILAVLRIHDILVWIRIRIQLFCVIGLKDTNKILILKKFSAYYFLKVHLRHFSKIKSQKEVEIKVFLTILSIFAC
jgi:hypothetical protein